MSAETKFTEAVENFDHGDRYQKYLSVVRLGLIAYGEEDEGERVFDYIMEHAPDPPPDRGKVRSAIRYALAHPLDPAKRPSSPSAPKQTEEERRASLDERLRQFVPTFLRHYADAETVEAVMETVNTDEADYLAKAGSDIYTKTAAAQIRAMFAPGEKIWAGQIIDTPQGKEKHAFDYRLLTQGGGIIEAHELARRIEAGRIHIPTQISLNPLTGGSSLLQNTKTKGTHPSYDCLATVADYRHIILEWDNLFDLDEQDAKRPSRAQIEIVAGLMDFARKNPHRIRLVAATSTGKKSIHCVVRVKASNRDEYKRQLDYLRDLFESADDPAFRIDTSGWNTGANAIEKCRLAGAIRPETGRRARLVHIWKSETTRPSAPPATATVEPVAPAPAPATPTASATRPTNGRKATPPRHSQGIAAASGTRRGKWIGTPDPKQWPALGTDCRGLCDACNLLTVCTRPKTLLGRAASGNGQSPEAPRQGTAPTG